MQFVDVRGFTQEWIHGEFRKCRNNFDLSPFWSKIIHSFFDKYIAYYMRVDTETRFRGLFDEVN